MEMRGSISAKDGDLVAMSPPLDRTQRRRRQASRESATKIQEKAILIAIGWSRNTVRHRKALVDSSDQ